MSVHDLLDDPDAIEAIRTLRQRGYTRRDVIDAWTAELPESTVLTRAVHKDHEAFDVYIGRPGPWGNPFVLGKDGNRAEVIEKYRAWLARHPELIDRARVELRGKRLGCFCKPLACHGDVLAAICNEVPS